MKEGEPSVAKGMVGAITAMEELLGGNPADNPLIEKVRDALTQAEEEGKTVFSVRAGPSGVYLNTTGHASKSQRY